MMTNIKWFNIGLRALMELGIVLAFGMWGFRSGNTSSVKFILGIGAPLLGFGFWGLFDFRQAGTWAEPLRLIQELFISGLAAMAFYVSGEPIWGLILGLVSIIHHVLIYLSGNRLVKSI